MKFDNELLSKRLESGTRDKTDASSREGQLLQQLEETNLIVKQRESVIEEKANESFQLKQATDGLRTERDKCRKKIEDVEDHLRQKEMEIT
jgi:chromosome segregation ATPase